MWDRELEIEIGRKSERVPAFQQLNAFTDFVFACE
jgi:hypothetical protein